MHLGAKAKGCPARPIAALCRSKRRTVKGSSIPADKILVTVGRRPNTEGWGLEKMAVDMEGPFVKVDDQCRTSMRNVWAIGDLVGEPMLAHKATAQGEMVAEIIAGQPRRFDPAAIAAVCFTEPEIVTAGLLPAEARRAESTITGLFPLSANGRALSMEAGDDGGFVRVVARTRRSSRARHPGGGRARLRTLRRIRAGARDGRGARGHRRHDPRPSDSERSLPRRRPCGHSATRSISDTPLMGA